MMIQLDDTTVIGALTAGIVVIVGMAKIIYNRITSGEAKCQEELAKAVARIDALEDSQQWRTAVSKALVGIAGILERRDTPPAANGQTFAVRELHPSEAPSTDTLLTAIRREHTPDA